MLKKTTQTLFVVSFLILTLVLAACGPAAAPEAGQPEATAAPTQEPAPTEPPAEATATEAAPSGPITIVDGFGREIALAGPAQAIISLAPSNTELLFAVGAGEQVVARDAFSDFPAQALDLADIGGGFSPLDLETIIALEPDLVMAADITPPEQIQELEDLGLAVFVLSNPLEFADLFDNIDLVGQLTGRAKEANLLNEDLRARVTAVRETVAQADENPLVFYQLDSTDPNAPWTPGPGNFVDTLIATSGGENIGADLDGAWVQISVEEIISQDPDVIFVGDFTWGGVTAEDVAARPGWDVIRAVQTGQVYEFDDNLVSRPGPRLVDGLEQMAWLLFPELFE